MQDNEQPADMAKNDDATMTFRLSTEMKAALETCAEDEDRSAASICRMAIEAYLKAWRERKEGE